MTFKVPSINFSATVFVSKDCYPNLEDWLTYPVATDRPGKVCYNFSIPSNLAEIFLKIGIQFSLG